MFKINKSANTIERLEKQSFSSLGFRERDHLQEWIAKQPDVLGEDLLIIQKEFSGFDDTQERLDLLALDKQGSLVIIENKLDDSGKDVTWQVLKYASYCSGLSKANITKIYQQYLDQNEPGIIAEDSISDFLDGQEYEELTLNKGVTQRIILTAAKFRKEVTSTVLWLMNFKIRVQCFKVTPFAMGEEIFLSVDQIIPTQDAEEYMIGMAEKAQDDIESQAQQSTRHVLRKEFWSRLIPAMNATNSNLYQNINSGTYHWIGAGSGVRGIGFNFAISRRYARAELYIDHGTKEDNKFIFDRLFDLKEKIEAAFNGELEWERLETRRACRIKAEVTANVFNRDQWEDMILFMTDAMCRLERAIRPLLKDVEARLKSPNSISFDGVDGVVG